MGFRKQQHQPQQPHSPTLRDGDHEGETPARYGHHQQHGGSSLNPLDQADLMADPLDASGSAENEGPAEPQPAARAVGFAATVDAADAPHSTPFSNVLSGAAAPSALRSNTTAPRRDDCGHNSAAARRQPPADREALNRPPAARTVRSSLA